VATNNRAPPSLEGKYALQTRVGPSFLSRPTILGGGKGGYFQWPLILPGASMPSKLGGELVPPSMEGKLRGVFPRGGHFLEKLAIV
jgi:hypothetical protein